MVIKPHQKLWSVDFKEIWRYRDLCAPDCHHEHGGFWRYCQDEYRWNATGFVLSLWQCLLALFLIVPDPDFQYIYF